MEMAIIEDGAQKLNQRGGGEFTVRLWKHSILFAGSAGKENVKVDELRDEPETQR